MVLMLRMKAVAILLASTLGSIEGQSAPCCIQPEINECSTIPYCNESRDNCVGNCGGIWDGPCLGENEACSATSLTCCDGSCEGGICVPPTIDHATYYFGHSLLYHTYTDYPNTNLMGVPYWMNLFYSASPSSTSNWFADGQFRLADYSLPPEPQWGFTPDISLWQGTLSSYTSVVFTEINFAQYQGPDEPYDYNNPYAITPIDSVVRIVDYVNNVDPSITIYIYECWNSAGTTVPDYYPQLGGNSNPTIAQRDAYYASTDYQSAYHQWWLDLMQGVLAQRPNANIQLVQVSPILISVLRSEYLSSATFQDVFEDNAPHGYPTAYFLAAMTLYMSMTGERPTYYTNPPTDGTLISQVTSNLDGIIDFIWDEINRGGPPPPSVPNPPSTPAPNPKPIPAPTPPPVPAPAPTPPQSYCCVQEEINGPNACTTVEYCNAAQANCEGDCEGIWSDLSAAPPVQPPVSPPMPAPVPAPTPPPVPAPVPTPPQSFCCVQEEINGPNACTTVEWCNAAQANCEGDCEGIWSDSSLF